MSQLLNDPFKDSLPFSHFTWGGKKSGQFVDFFPPRSDNSFLGPLRERASTIFLPEIARGVLWALV